MKGIIHFHSQHSYDSLLAVSKIARIALENGLTFILLTDHNTIKGSLALRDYIKSKKMNIVAPIAAEYQTEYGDIIAVFIQEEIKERSFLPFIKRVRDQNGLLFLPHPYFKHQRINFIAKHVDFIEVFNSRKSQEQDVRSFNLAQKHNKRTFFGSDAHSSNDLMNVILSLGNNESEEKLFSDRGDLMLKELLLRSEIKCLENRKTKAIDIYFSQYVKAYKIRSPKLFFSLSMSLTGTIIQKAISQIR